MEPNPAGGCLLWFREEFLQKMSRRGGLFRAAMMAIFLASMVFPRQAEAQSGQPVFDATQLHEPSDLGSEWLVHAGDDPAYARPDFDDSQWTKFDPHKDIKSIFTASHPEVVWYRLHLRTSPTQTDLALATYEFSRAWEI